MGTSNNLIKAIVDEDFVSAKELTGNLLHRAISDRLDDVKREVAADLFNGMDDAVNEGKDDPKPLVPNAPKKGSAASEAGGKGLKGKQYRIDANKNGKIDAHDFKILRSKGKKG
jgi:hypothetical protein